MIPPHSAPVSHRVSDTLVVCSHLPGEGHYRSQRFLVHPVVCDDDHDYWRGLAAVWDTPATLVNVEHDVEVTDEHVQTLADCPEVLCAWDVPLHWASTGLPYDTVGGIGLVKMTAAARVRPLRREPWQRVELAVADAVCGGWHRHDRPAVHHHHY